MTGDNFNKEKMEEIKNRGKDSPRRGLPNGMKKCPFQSSFEDVPCTPDCALYRANKQAGYNCPILELPHISWTLKGQPPSKNWNGNYNRK